MDSMLLFLLSVEPQPSLPVQKAYSSNQHVRKFHIYFVYIYFCDVVPDNEVCNSTYLKNGEIQVKILQLCAQSEAFEIPIGKFYWHKYGVDCVEEMEQVAVDLISCAYFVNCYRVQSPSEPQW